MSGLHEVDCAGCGRRYEMSIEEARKQRVLRCRCGQFVRLDRGLGDARSEPAPGPASAPSQPGPASRPTRTPSRPAGKYASAPPSSEKKLWYVNLGGSETVEMTIEQLIIARRSGKLGEGALVWREGMPRWRPVGTLIPATSVSARPTPTPAARRPAPPPPPPVPSRPTSPLPAAPFASYERPVATLEFAMDGPEVTPARATPTTPSRPQRSPQPSLGSTPGRPSLTDSAPPHVVSAPIASAPLTEFNSVRPTLPPAEAHLVDWLGERPRWVSACMALLVCIVASGTGAFLVRSLRVHQKPLVLAPSVMSQPSPPSLATGALEFPAAAAVNRPLVVDLESLSVEPVKPRAPRALPIAASKPAPSQAGSGDDNADANHSPPAPAGSAAGKSEQSAAERGDLLKAGRAVAPEAARPFRGDEPGF